MPIYSPKSEDSHPNFLVDVNKVLSPDVETPSTFVITLGAGDTQNVHFITQPFRINSDAWESGGTMTCNIRVTAVTGNVRIRCMLRRLNEAGTLLQTGTFTGFQSISTAPTTYTFTPTVPTWTTDEEACGNRLVVRFGVNSPSAGGMVTIEVGSADSEVDSPITENNGNCRRINIS